MKALIYEIIIYVFFINAGAFALTWYDKSAARAGRRRISERTLILFALLGGSAGELCAMRAFRHKTRHRKFTLGVPIILAAQLAMAVWLIVRQALTIK